MHKTLWQSPSHRIPPLEKDTIHVWRVSLDTFDANFCFLESILSSDEKKRAAKFKFTEHRQRFIVTRNVLRHILGYYLNQHPSTLVFQSSYYGKPYLVNQPIAFNLSHAGQYILYAIGLQKDIGIDIEKMRHTIRLEDIAERFLSVYENQCLSRIAAHQKIKAFFRLWTCKEAFIKAIGKGLSFPLQAFDVDIMQDTPHLVQIRDTHRLRDIKVETTQKWSLSSIEAPKNYVATLASRQHITTIKLYDFQRPIQNLLN